MGLFDFVKRALTPPGTSEANRDSSRKGYPQKIAGNLLSEFEPMLMGSARTLRNNQGGIQRAYQNLFDLANPLKVEGRVASTRQKLLSDAEEEATMLKAKYAGTGGIGLEQGLGIAGRNSANAEANDLFTHFNSPEGIAELSSIIIQLQKDFPGADIFAMLNAMIQGRPAPPVGADPLTSIGNIASLFVKPQVPGVGSVSTSGGSGVLTGSVR